jgi:TonB family protein
MAPLPPLTPPPPEAPGARPSRSTRSSITADMNTGPDGAERVLSKLRALIAGGRQERDTILGTIAVAAQALTGSSGAAIAMPRDGTVTCIGRSGEIAPELGERLSVDSGISGECLRTGTIMRCNDTARDIHVDAEVCRQLNLKSIAVVPLRGRHGRVGVLEAFSTRSYAFSDDHMTLLGRLAGLAEAAWAQAPETETLELEMPETHRLAIEYEYEPDAQVLNVAANAPTAADAMRHQIPAQNQDFADSSVALAQFARTLSTGLHRGELVQRRWRRVAITALGVVPFIVLAIFIWKMWYKASLPVSSGRSDGNSRQAVPVRPDAAHGRVSLKGAGSRSSAPRLDANPSAHTMIRPSGTLSTMASPIAESPDPSAIPPNISSSGAVAELENVLAGSPSMPKLQVPISQGVSGGVLVHKVMPVYPPEARQTHAQGIVVIEGTVTEQGQLEDLKLISGPTVLANSAMEAVRKWRYTPYILNGKPIRKNARISISFLAP